jgi:hypothetical protein
LVTNILTLKLHYNPNLISFRVELPVATLALGSRPRQRGLQGYGPRKRKPESQGKGIARVWAKRKLRSHITYSQECKKCEGMWGSEHSHSQGNSHFGRWSPGGLPKFQRAITGVKTQWLVAFFISLKSS